MKNLQFLTGLIVVYATSTASAAGPEDAVVKVTSTRRFPNVIRPWTKRGRPRRWARGW